MFDLFLKLREAYETTTPSYNRFKEVIDSIKWENIFTADGEIYFCKEGFTLTVENLDPFAEDWKPTGFFSDGSIISF